MTPEPVADDLEAMTLAQDFRSSLTNGSFPGGLPLRLMKVSSVQCCDRSGCPANGKVSVEYRSDRLGNTMTVHERSRWTLPSCYCALVNSLPNSVEPDLARFRMQPPKGRVREAAGCRQFQPIARWPLRQRSVNGPAGSRNGRVVTRRERRTCLEGRSFP